MSTPKLRISGPDGQTLVELNPNGTLIGRDPSCDVRLALPSVSRHHARIHRDAFGRWIIEDLNSHNGVFVDGRRIDGPALLSGRDATIVDCRLSLIDDMSRHSFGGGNRETVTLTAESAEEEVRSFRSSAAESVGPDLLPALNAIIESLMRLSSPAELYGEACRHLARWLRASTSMLRLPLQGETLPDQPELLAHESEDPNAPGGLRFSRRVLDAARGGEGSIMARSHSRSEKSMQLTIATGSSPRVVYAAPVNRTGDSMDLLYVDLPEAEASEPTFAFVEAVARQISFVQTSLFYAELERKERALREANQALQEQDRIKDEYVFRITHDIKGHIAAIQSCLSIADGGSGLGTPEQKAEFMDRASRRTGQLLTFIDDLLRLTRLRLSGELTEEPFDLEEVLAGATETVAPEAGSKSIALESSFEPGLGTVTGDRLSITEVVTNLLFNAIKYTPEGGAVALRATARDSRARIAICDSGIGIPADEIGKVFDEFFRASNAAAFAKDGTGLGLALVRQIVERHGGTVAAENNADRGATFTVELRLDPSAPSGR